MCELWGGLFPKPVPRLMNWIFKNFSFNDIQNYLLIITEVEHSGIVIVHLYLLSCAVSSPILCPFLNEKIRSFMGLWSYFYNKDVNIYSTRQQCLLGFIVCFCILLFPVLKEELFPFFLIPQSRTMSNSRTCSRFAHITAVRDFMLEELIHVT